ncbi:hypothetical protein ES702_03867 [subsurface metagenome]
MVQIVQGSYGEHEHYGGGRPEVHIHGIHRLIHGNGIMIKVYGQVKIAAKEVIFARELKLNTLKELQLTPDYGGHFPLIAKKWIYNKSEFDNYASVDIFCVSAEAYEMTAGDRVLVEGCPAELPEDGSIWLNFDAWGE